MQEHSTRRLNIHRGKSKILKVNSSSRPTASVTLGMEAIEEIDHFTYLGSVVDTQCGTEADVKASIGKARVAFLPLKNIWNPTTFAENKVRIFNTNIKTVLLYGAETRRTTVITTKRIQTVVNSYLRRILDIWWHEIISNERSRQRTCQIPVEQEIRQKRWRWIGHTLRKPVDSITRQALTTWNPEGKRKTGRPWNTWRRDLEADVKETGYTWR